MSSSTQIMQRLAQDHFAARDYFPRGLFQPAGSFRFSLDALLLASLFQVQETEKTLLDLGTGCGVVALGMLCRFPWLRAVGLDMQESLIMAANKNAQQLGFSESFLGIHADMRKMEQSVISSVLRGNKQDTSGKAPSREKNNTAKNIFINENGESEGIRQLPDTKFDLVLANPPYRKRGTGRLPANESRSLALFEDENTLQAFCHIASQTVSVHGRVGVIYPVKRNSFLLEALIAEGLQPISLLFVQSRQEDSPFLFLVTAQKTVVENTKSALRTHYPLTESSLTLHEGVGTEATLTREAVAFCPWLGCKARQF